MRLERLELRQGAAGEGGGSSLSHEDTLALLEGLVSRREAALKEGFRRDTAARIQVGEGSCGLRADRVWAGRRALHTGEGPLCAWQLPSLCLVSSSLKWRLSSHPRSRPCGEHEAAEGLAQGLTPRRCMVKTRGGWHVPRKRCGRKAGS